MSGYKLSPYERETVINFSDGNGTADVYTHDARLIRRLRELSGKYPEQFVFVRTDGRPAIYRILKKCVAVRAPYSGERRERQRREAALYGLPFVRKEAQDA